ncbi:MAG: hypothetical protein OXR66_09365 [Candidatus Woesearchaeota archaeon]|nr:hypothetical protein [Candidatus Woesearchaeota archaeon]
MEVTPLPHEWMLVSIIGFFVSWLQVYTYMSMKWGAAFMLFFIITFTASMVSMSYASTEEEHLQELAIHEVRKWKRHKA